MYKGLTSSLMLMVCLQKKKKKDKLILFQMHLQLSKDKTHYHKLVTLQSTDF